MIKRLFSLLVLFCGVLSVSTAQAIVIRPTVFVVDTSGSMNGQDQYGQNKIDAAKNTFSTIIQSIEQEQSISTIYTDQIALVKFDGSARILSEFTNDYQNIQNVISNLRADGGTNMRDGVAQGISLIETLALQTSGTTAPNMILMTDGVPTAPGGFSDDELRQQINALMPQLQQLGACLYIVPIGNPNAAASDEDFVDIPFLQGLIAQVGCGALYPVTNVADLVATYINIRLQINNSDVIYQDTFNLQANQTITVPTINVLPNTIELRLDTLWGQGTVVTEIFDPNGQPVRQGYPGLQPITLNNLTQYFISNPTPGIWTVRLRGESDIPPQGTQATVIASQIITPVPTIDVTPVPKPPTPTTVDNTPLLILMLLMFMVLVGGVILVLLMVNRNSALSQLDLRAHLVVQNGPAQGLVIPITSDKAMIGRGGRNFVNLRGKDVSRQHAVIRYMDGNFIIEDLDSTVGTYVNNQRIRTAHIQSGDMIRVGSTNMQFNIAPPQ